MGFDDYFLIVWDLCRFSWDQGIWWNVRGSGAASIVAYTLRHYQYRPHPPQSDLRALPQSIAYLDARYRSGFPGMTNAIF